MSEKLKMQREEKLKAVLKELGAGKNKIAETLKAKKIKGNFNDIEDCPVVNYLWKAFPKAESIFVDGDETTITFKDGMEIQQDHSKALSAFIGAFDDSDDDGECEYPELVAKE